MIEKGDLMLVIIQIICVYYVAIHGKIELIVSKLHLRTMYLYED